MYVLTLNCVPIACAEREERLDEQAALYSAAEQNDMTITSVEELD